MHAFLLALVVACAPRVEAPVAHSPEGVTLHGTAPASPLAAPEFAATDRDGTPRDRSSLLGHPTVLWFYPAAGTGG